MFCRLIIAIYNALVWFTSVYRSRAAPLQKSSFQGPSSQHQCVLQCSCSHCGTESCRTMASLHPHNKCFLWYGAPHAVPQFVREPWIYVCTPPEAIEVPDSQKYHFPRKIGECLLGAGHMQWQFHRYSSGGIWSYTTPFTQLLSHMQLHYNGSNLSSDVSSHTHTTTPECKRCTRDKYILDL